MTFNGQTAAAARCGAEVAVWDAVHRLHLARRRAVVTAKHSTAVGPIVTISDEGFGLGDGVRFTWPEVYDVREQ